MIIRSRRGVLVVLLALFAGSGCSALIYEIVWFQLLQLVIGSSAVSLGVLLGTFMGGMCLGSIALPRLVSARHHPLRVYACLEMATGLVAVAVVFTMPWVGGLYTASIGHGLPGIVLRGLVCALCLLPPTILIGATLPAIARWVGTTSRGVSRLGLLYGGNIAGAVFGSLVAGFYLLRLYDMATATYVAAAINIVVAIVSLAASRVLPHAAPSPEDEIVDNADERDHAAEPARPRHEADVWPVYAAVALSGMTALGAEVVWTRVLALMFGATVYTFSIILAVFLTGLGIGSGAASLLLRRRGRLRAEGASASAKASARLAEARRFDGERRRSARLAEASAEAGPFRLMPAAMHPFPPRAALAACQLLLAVAIAWTAFLVARALPYWSSFAVLTSPWSLFGLDLVRSMAALLPATCLWGASFPLALAAAAPREDDAARLVGRMYAANTLGAIVGAIGFSMAIIPLVGTADAERLLIVLSVGAAALIVTPSTLARRLVATASAAMAAALLAWSVSTIPPLLVAYGRWLPSVGNGPAILYVGEGVNASVAVAAHENGIRSFHVSGKVEASNEALDMRLQRLLGNLPALLQPEPRSVLVVGFGSGVTAGSFVPHSDVARVVICEIEPLIPARVAPYFAQENYGVLSDPRVHLVIDDARHYVLTTREKFDVVTSDPIHPWVKGAATLYTKEYFELLKQHLNTDGIVAQWVPLYESDPEVVRSEVATFFDVFPHGTIWGNPHMGEGYDIVLLGTTGPLRIDVEALQRRLDGRGFAGVVASLREVGFLSATDLLATYAGSGARLAPWLQGAEINRDHNLRLQYLAGLGLHADHSSYIYDEILRHRQFDGDLFIASDAMKQQLLEAAARLRAGP